MPALRVLPILTRTPLVLALSFACLALAPASADAARGEAEFKAKLSSADRKAFENYMAAKSAHAFRLDKYWKRVSSTRKARRAKMRRGYTPTSKDYVQSFPPSYKGPKLSKSLARRWKKFQQTPAGKPKKRRSLPTIKQYLAYSKKHYNFSPEVIPEREFKRRYAREALRLGLTKDQVIRVYALETGGLGTADMVAGIHPIRKTGRPISSALGYAQLLAANTTDELVKHGSGFLKRLRAMADAPGVSAERRARLKDKIAKMGSMLRAAKSIPHRWSKHVTFSKTGRGRGIHAINLDGDVGPWLQVIKLYGLKQMARRAGYTSLTGPEIELMNLAGPGTGLEMMKPAGRKAPTPNFFARNAYGRNTIVRGKTSQQLLKALEKRMDHNMKNSGALEFAKVFDQVATE